MGWISIKFNWGCDRSTSKYVVSFKRTLCARVLQSLWNHNLALRSSLFALGSSLFALGSWLFALGSWLFALRSWLFALRSWLFALRSWLLALRASLLALRSAIFDEVVSDKLNANILWPCVPTFIFWTLLTCFSVIECFIWHYRVDFSVKLSLEILKLYWHWHLVN